MQKTECMLHILLQHLVCREVRLTATTSRGKSLDEAVNPLDLALGILNTSVRADEWWGCFQSYCNFLLLWFSVKKLWFSPNIFIKKKINRNLSVSTTFCPKQIKCSKPPCLSLSHIVATYKPKERIWRQQNILFLTFSECISFTVKSSHTLEFPKPLRLILKETHKQKEMTTATKQHILHWNL